MVFSATVSEYRLQIYGAKKAAREGLPATVAVRLKYEVFVNNRLLFLHFWREVVE